MKQGGKDYNPAMIFLILTLQDKKGSISKVIMNE